MHKRLFCLLCTLSLGLLSASAFAAPQPGATRQGTPQFQHRQPGQQFHGQSGPRFQPQQPPVVRPQPPVTKPQPPVTKPQPPVTKPQPPVTRPQPPVTKPQPPVTKPQPPVVKQPPVRPNPNQPQPNTGWGNKRLPPAPANVQHPKCNPNPKVNGPLPRPPVVDRRTYPMPYHQHLPIPIPHTSAFYSGFYIGGVWHQEAYCAHQHYCPTTYFYNVNSRFWWGYGVGYSWTAPAAMPATITIVVTETVDVTFFDDATWQTITYQHPLLWYYNAYWDAGSSCYVYQDLHGNLRSVSW